MKQLVHVRAEAPDHYIAQAVGFPEIKAVGRTEAEAVGKVHRSLILARYMNTPEL